MSERYEDFSSFLEEDRVREYGFGPLYPSFISSTIDFTKGSSKKQIIQNRKEVVQRVIALMEKTEAEEQALHQKLKPHLQNLYKGKRLVLFRELLRIAVESDPETAAKKDVIMAMCDKLVEGFSMDGELAPTGFWKKVSEKKLAEMRAEMEATNTERSRTAPDRAHWASEEDLQELWRQREAMLASGRWHEGDVSQIGRVGGAVAFPVHQGGKVRVCIDLRSQNTQVLVHEVIRLLNARATAQIIGKLMANNYRQPQFFQFKSDIQADIEQEKVLRAYLEENDRVIAESAKTASLDPEPDPDSETEFAFTPVSQKRDMRQFYYQCGVADPRSNAIWFQKPTFGKRHSTTADELGISAPKRRKIDKPEWVLTFSDCSVFGARTSIHECCGVSECLMLILNKAINILCTLYIDDVHCLSRRDLAVFDGAVLDFVMSAMGFWFSEGKTERQDYFLQKVLVVLGMAYTLKTQVLLTIEVEAKKLKQLLEQGIALIISIEQKRCIESDLLSYKGLYRHCTQLDRTKSYLARALDFWIGENFVRNIVRTKERRQLLTSVQTMQRAATKVKPLSMSPSSVNAPIAHVYTDAAADDLPALNELLKKGVRKGLDRFNLKVGGFLQLPSGVTKSFSMHIKELPGQVDSVSIGGLEAVAARLAVDKFKEDLKGHFTILHVDNMGDVYCLSRNASRSFLIQSVCSQFHKLLMDFDLQVYVTWICTSRNVADVLTRSKRTQLLLEHFPDCLHAELPHSLSLNLRMWGLSQSDEDPSSCL